MGAGVPMGVAVLKESFLDGGGVAPWILLLADEVDILAIESDTRKPNSQGMSRCMDPISFEISW